MPSRLILAIFYATSFAVAASRKTSAAGSYGTPAKRSRGASPAFVGPIKPNPRKDLGLFAEEERSYSSDLDTAYEWLAKERARNDPDRHDEIRWFHPHPSGTAITMTGSGTEEDGDNVGAVETIRMPLYPLGAVHIPHAGENSTIVNIEPKNVKMAMDLVSGKWEGSLFCASLRTRDTHRVATVGTILQLLDTEDRSISGARTWPGDVLPTLNRVVANCRAVGVVDILSIEERDYEEDDYLIAQVRVRSLAVEGPTEDDGHATTTERENDGEHNSIAQQAIDDYQKVRSIYINSESLASNELPKFARKAMETLPTFHTDIVHDEFKFWKLVDTWNVLCNTIRQSKRTQLQDIVNELSVAVAMQAKGVLELPVKRKSLPMDVQRQLGDIEESAAMEFMELGMDPVLDFQEILAMEDHWGRVSKLAGMMRRERSRLEAKESLIRMFMEKEYGEEALK